MHLLREVEKFMRRCDVPATRFGKEALGDPRFVFDLRNGRDPARERSPGSYNIWIRRMIRVLMSSAAAALLRALLARAGVPREKILLTDIRSVDWQSLTIIGERHEIAIRIPGPFAAALAASLCDGLAEAEFAIPGHIVADIVVADGPTQSPDGSISLSIEALTVFTAD